MSLSKTFSRWLVSVATLGALLSLGAMFSAHHWLFDLISHFRVQYIVLLTPVFIIAMMSRRTLGVLVISVALAIHGYVVTMSILPRSGIASDEEPVILTVLSSNLLASNDNAEPIVNLIDSTAPDIISFQEYTDNWDTELSAALSAYPYKASYPRPGVFGIAVYSKYPFTNEQLITVESIPYAKVELQLDNKPIEIYAIHPIPPVSPTTYAQRNAILSSVALETKNAEHAIVLGDFNASPWTAHFTHMMRDGKLHSASAGFGLHTTWPTLSPVTGFLMQIPIDHIALSERIRSTAFDSAKLDGFDHRAVWSTVSVY